MTCTRVVQWVLQPVVEVDNVWYWFGIVGGMVVVMVFKRGRLAVEACQLGFGRDEGLLDPFLTRKWVRLSHMVPESVKVGRGYVDDYAAVDDSDETVGIARHDHLLGSWIASSMLKVVE